MLSGEGNAGERWKTTIGLISKKATLHVRHTFFVHFFAVVLHNYNVKLAETSWSHVLSGKCRTFSRSLFSHYRSFSPCIGDRWHFSFCHRRYKIFMHVVLPTKNVSFFFFFFHVELRWPAAYFLFFSVFLLLYIALYIALSQANVGTR